VALVLNQMADQLLRLQLMVQIVHSLVLLHILQLVVVMAAPPIWEELEMVDLAVVVDLHQVLVEQELPDKVLPEAPHQLLVMEKTL
jgi:hypothetical protein